MENKTNKELGVYTETGGGHGEKAIVFYGEKYPSDKKYYVAGVYSNGLLETAEFDYKYTVADSGFACDNEKAELASYIAGIKKLLGEIDVALHKDAEAWARLNLGKRAQTLNPWFPYLDEDFYGANLPPELAEKHLAAWNLKKEFDRKIGKILEAKERGRLVKLQKPTKLGFRDKSYLEK